MYQCINNATKWYMLKCKYNHKKAPFKGETSYVILRNRNKFQNFLSYFTHEIVRKFAAKQINLVLH